MIMQRVQIDISSDIFDKVIRFLEHLPKNKVKFNFKNILIPNNNQNKIKFGLAKGKTIFIDDIMAEDKNINDMFYGN